MKRNFPGILKVFVPMTAIAVALLIQACAQFVVDVGHGVYGLIIRRPVPIKNEAALKVVLKKLRKPGVTYHFHLARDNGTSEDFDWGSDITIKTDRVIMTELALSRSKDELTPIGATLSHKIYVTKANDIAVVLDQVKAGN